MDGPPSLSIGGAGRIVLGVDVYPAYRVAGPHGTEIHAFPVDSLAERPGYHSGDCAYLTPDMEGARLTFPAPYPATHPAALKRTRVDNELAIVTGYRAGGEAALLWGYDKLASATKIGVGIVRRCLAKPKTAELQAIVVERKRLKSEAAEARAARRDPARDEMPAARDDHKGTDRDQHDRATIRQLRPRR